MANAKLAWQFFFLSQLHLITSANTKGNEPTQEHQIIKVNKVQFSKNIECHYLTKCIYSILRITHITISCFNLRPHLLILLSPPHPAAQRQFSPCTLPPVSQKHTEQTMSQPSSLTCLTSYLTDWYSCCLITGTLSYCVIKMGFPYGIATLKAR